MERLIAEGVFARQDCGLLHGQMSPAEKDGVLQRFKAGDVKLLVRCGRARAGARELTQRDRTAMGGGARLLLRRRRGCRPSARRVAPHPCCSTTVVEVGVDVPQATVMVIEHAGEAGQARWQARVADRVA